MRRWSSAPPPGTTGEELAVGPRRADGSHPVTADQKATVSSKDSAGTSMKALNQNTCRP